MEERPTEGATDGSSDVRFDAGREIALARAFVRLSDTLVTDYDVGELLDDLSQTCRDLLDVDAAGILLVKGDGLELASASSTDVRDIEVFQIQTDQGPCRDCVRTGAPVSTSDLSRESSWPRFAAVALRRGVKAVHAMPLRLRDDVIGGINLFRRSTYAWSADDMTTARALADVATIGILQHRISARSDQVQQQLQQALDSRVRIEQAKGMLAAQAHVSPDDAFVGLRRYARSNNLRLGSVAQQVVDRALDHRTIGVDPPPAT